MGITSMRLPLALLGLVGSLGAALPAWGNADARIVFLTRQLEKAKDPRVKAQAALMLGAVNDPQARPPLCASLADGSDVVRAAAAKGLAELKDVDAIPCLTPHLRDDSPTVAMEVKQTLTLLQKLKNRRPELYIALGPIADKGAGLSSDLMQLANNRLRAKLFTMGSLFAPDGESRSDARRTIEERRLKKAFMLMPTFVRLPNGGLQMNVLCLTYPERSILGEVNVKAAGGGQADLIRA
ncbi:MAG TPA: HEAT repeat domain-containing protein, partial [Myxococcaceae bacterium]|nr:HEAT repeat domain-containing protein [Myxococcaceae bacterium]